IGYQGIMYLVRPGVGVLALGATNGDLIWDYSREYPKQMTDFIGAPTAARQKGLAIFEDMIFFESADGFLVALDARTGKVRWETKVQDYKELTQHTSAPLVVEGKVITGRTCETRAGCFIAAHDARTGKAVWQCCTPAAASGAAAGRAGGRDPRARPEAGGGGRQGSVTRTHQTFWWAAANPKPNTRPKRHGSAGAPAQPAPADLYSNSTLALDIETGQ